MNMSPFLTVNLTCDRTLSWVSEQLLKVGLRGVQTFDLHIARAGLHGCECPHHGTEQCDCQMVVLLVYGSTTEPVTLILHGNNGQTWLSIPNRTASSGKLVSQIQNSLQIDNLPVVE